MQYIFDGKCGGVQTTFFKGGGDVSPRKYIVATPMFMSQLIKCSSWSCLHRFYINFKIVVLSFFSEPPWKRCSCSENNHLWEIVWKGGALVINHNHFHNAKMIGFHTTETDGCGHMLLTMRASGVSERLNAWPPQLMAPSLVIWLDCGLWYNHTTIMSAHYGTPHLIPGRTDPLFCVPAGVSCS